MTRTARPALLAAAACAALLAGCAGGSDGTTATSPQSGYGDADPAAAEGAGPGMPPAQNTDARPGRRATQVVDPCDATADCTYIGQADVDGDGTPDPIGIVFTAQTGQTGSGALRVAADGAVDTLPFEYSTTIRSVDDLYTGAFRFSRADATDIVLHVRPGGGNAEKFYVATWQDGGLAWLPPFAQVKSGSDTAGWFLQSSHGSTNEIGCKGGGVASFETVYAPTVEGMAQPNGDTRDIQRYTRADGRWIAGALEHVADPNGWDMDWDAATEAFQCSDDTLPPA